MIILEGMDGSGKSTLFNQLAKALSTVSDFQNVLMYPSRGIPQDPDDVAFRLVEETNWLTTRKLLVDRSDIVSGWVYGGLNCPARVLELADTKRLLTEHPTFFVYCDPLHGVPAFLGDNYQARYKELWEQNIRRKYFRRSKMREPGAFDEVLKRYNDFVTFGVKPDVVYNWELDDIETVWSGVKSYLLG